MKKAIERMEALEANLVYVERSSLQIMKKVEALFQKIRDLHEGHQVIRFEDLAATPKLQWFELGTGVHAMHLPSTQNSLLFVLRIEANSTLTWHYHDCFERLTLLEGDLHAAGNLIARTLLIKPYERHELYSPTGAYIHLELYR